MHLVTEMKRSLLAISPSKKLPHKSGKLMQVTEYAEMEMFAFVLLDSSQCMNRKKEAVCDK